MLIHFTKTINDIINDLIILFNKKHNNCDNKSKIINILSEFIKILITKNRMFYVGILILFISFIFYFIDIAN